MIHPTLPSSESRLAFLCPASISTSRLWAGRTRQPSGSICRLSGVATSVFRLAGVLVICGVSSLTSAAIAQSESQSDTETPLTTATTRSTGTPSAIGSPSRDWPVPRGDAQSTGFAPESLSDDLQVLWQFTADEAIETTPVVAGGRVYISDMMGHLYALSQHDGKEIWRREYDTIFSASPAVHGDLLVIGDVDGNLYGIDAVKGTELWKQTTEGEISGAAAFHKSNVLITSWDGSLYCFAAKDGTPVWKYETGDQVRCSPTLAGDLTFLGGCDGQLHIVDLNTGKPLGEPLPLGGPTGSTPAVWGDHAFLPIMDGVVFAFDWKQRNEIWQHEDPQRPQEYQTSAAVSKELVVISSQFRQVDAISAQTGKLKWRHTLKRRADASPVIAGNDVWIASTDGRLIRLSVTDGTERWSYEIRGAFLAAPAIAWGRLYIADDNGVVHCFGPAADTKL
jgi:outer membrane protein assembly factor BamB